MHVNTSFKANQSTPQELEKKIEKDLPLSKYNSLVYKGELRLRQVPELKLSTKILTIFNEKVSSKIGVKSKRRSDAVKELKGKIQQANSQVEAFRENKAFGKLAPHFQSIAQEALDHLFDDIENKFETIIDTKKK